MCRLLIGYWWQGPELGCWSCLWIKGERICCSNRDLQLLLVTWSQPRSESPGALKGADTPKKARGRTTPLELSTPESQAALDLHCHVCLRCFLVHTLLSSLQKGKTGLCSDLQHKELPVILVGVIKYGAFPIFCQAGFLARAVNSLLALCPLRNPEVPFSEFCLRKNGRYILVRSFSDKAELGF